MSFTNSEIRELALIIVTISPVYSMNKFLVKVCFYENEI